MQTIARTTTILVDQAREMHREGRITAGDLRDIQSALEGNGSAINGVRAFLAAR